MTASQMVMNGDHVQHIPVAEMAKLCMMETKLRAELRTKTYGEVVKKLNEVRGWGRHGLIPKYERLMVFDRIPTPFRILKWRVGGLCYFCGHETSRDFPGPIYRKNHRGKEVKKSECGYCQVCGEDNYALQIVQDEEFRRWKGMKVQKQLLPIRILRAVISAIPVINLIKISALEETRVETIKGLVTTGAVYRERDRFTTSDMTNESLLQLQAYHLNQAFIINQHLEKSRGKS